MESTRTDHAADAATAPDGRRVSVFADDALGRHDAVGLADALRRREVSPDEVLAATRDRLAAAADLNAVVGSVFETPVAGSPAGPFGGVPTLLKDNSDLAGVPTGVGSEIVREVPVSSHGPVARELLRMGLTIIAKSTLPEFGLSASTEFPTRPPTSNPWHTGYSSGPSGAKVQVAFRVRTRGKRRLRGTPRRPSRARAAGGGMPLDPGSDARAGVAAGAAPGAPPLGLGAGDAAAGHPPPG
ncbi:amidase family protein, partial [Rhodococcoides kroppenstedtii]|uniref:amidase family protein n=1 Tax=Rhodococcoides kroppenstedtii TaxID=293050 RepID=UPI00200D5AB0